MDALIAALNPAGHREFHLKTALQAAYPKIVALMERKETHGTAVLKESDEYTRRSGRLVGNSTLPSLIVGTKKDVQTSAMTYYNRYLKQ